MPACRSRHLQRSATAATPARASGGGGSPERCKWVGCDKLAGCNICKRWRSCGSSDCCIAAVETPSSSQQPSLFLRHSPLAHQMSGQNMLPATRYLGCSNSVCGSSAGVASLSRNSTSSNGAAYTANALSFHLRAVIKVARWLVVQRALGCCRFAQCWTQPKLSWHCDAPVACCACCPQPITPAAHPFHLSAAAASAVCHGG